MSQVLILGGSGHLGSALRQSARSGTDVIAAFASNTIAGGVPFRFEASEALPDANVVIGTFPLARCLEQCSEAKIDEAVDAYVDHCRGARIVQMSTDAVFSGARGGYGEADAVDPTTAYGRAQAAVDTALLKYAQNCLIVRTSFIFGWSAGRFDKRLAPFAHGDKEPVAQKWANNIYRAPTEVNFLAEAIWRAIQGGTAGILNIVGPRLSIYDFFCKALDEVGQFEMPPQFEETDTSIAQDTSLSAARLEAELSMSEGEVWEWYQRIMRRRRAR